MPISRAVIVEARTLLHVRRSGVILAPVIFFNRQIDRFGYTFANQSACHGTDSSAITVPNGPATEPASAPARIRLQFRRSRAYSSANWTGNRRARDRVPLRPSCGQRPCRGSSSLMSPNEVIAVIVYGESRDFHAT